MAFQLHQGALGAGPTADGAGQGGEQQVVDLGAISARCLLQQLRGALGIQGQGDFLFMTVFQGARRTLGRQVRDLGRDLRLPVGQLGATLLRQLLQVCGPGLVGAGTWREGLSRLAIQLLQVFQQYAPGHPIHRPVVDHQQQALAAIGQVDQHAAQQWALLQIQAALGSLAQLGELLRIACLTQPQQLAGLLGIGLLPASDHWAHAQAQRIVMLGQARQRFGQALGIQGLAGLQQQRLVPVLALRYRLFHEPVLYRRQRQLAAGRAAVLLAEGHRLGHLGQATQGLVLEQVPWAERQASLAGAADHLDGNDRVATQGEEIVIQADLLHRQQRSPDLGQGLLGPLARCTVRSQLHLTDLAQQGLAIELAVGGHGHAVQQHPLRRYHVVRQAAAQVCSQCLAPVSRGLLQDQVTHQLLTVHHQHRGFAHLRMLQQARLDLAQLDTQAAQLDLVIQAPQVLDHAIGALAHAVAGAIQARAIMEWARYETLGSQRRTPMIAAGQTGTAQVELASDPGRHRQ